MAQLKSSYLSWGVLSGLLWISPGFAAAAELSAPLKPLAFLVGRWEGAGEARDAGAPERGVSTISVEADGRVLLRRDLASLAGQPGSSFSQVMMIYAEADGVHGDYVDGEGHVIHYSPARIDPGRSVEFTSAGPAGAPVFRLRYDAWGEDGLKVAFMIRPPGASGFRPIAVGEMHRVR